jgi:predicted adenine nucleotide alpha hydrolase (AANH) superfamily ATPase
LPLRGLNVDALTGFLIGVGVSLTGAIVANILARNRERRRIVEERRFAIYMKLMELYGSYFWSMAAELKSEPAKGEICERCRDLAWQINDMLRSVDEVEFLEDVLDVTLGPSFSSAQERYKKMGSLLERMGNRVNPRYAKKIRDINEANLQNIAAGGRSNAPGQF